MELIEFQYPAKYTVPRRAHVGVVGSGDLEVLLEPVEGSQARVSIVTSVNGFKEIWQAVFDRFFAAYAGAVHLQIHDAGATPGTVLLRVEQAVEESSS